jgi:ribose-phosphate pyrophosphokinase
MSPPLLLVPWTHPLAAPLLAALGATPGEVEVRRFPDGESHVRLVTSPAGRDVVVLASLDHPDDKLVALVLLCATARELGARSLRLVAPYLGYLRQDRRFREGEAVSARVFPRLLGPWIDALVTVDPHLHRVHDLAEVYDVPCRVVRAAPAIAAWIADHVDRPLIVGPDSESAQWVEDVASRAGAPWIVLEKVRHGDRDVEVSVPDVERWRDHTPVLVDDIVSTGRTLVQTLGHLARAGMRPATCVGVHALFAGDALDALRAAGAGAIVTTDAVPHPTNTIGLAGLLAGALR